MRRFVGYRPEPPAEYLEKGTAAPPDQPQYEGVVFTDGSVALRWRTAYRSTSVWNSYSDFEHVHGHPEYGTRIEWPDDTAAEMWRIRAEYAERRLQALHRALEPLCPCDLNTSTTDGPQQECPLHGDGVTFVEWVTEMQNELALRRASVTTGGPAPAFTEGWERGESSRPSTAPPEN